MIRSADRGRIVHGPAGWTVTFVRYLPARPTQVWDALTQPERLARWLARTDLEDVVGGALTVHFDDAAVTGEVEAWEPPHVFATSWVFSDGTRTAVRFELQALDDGNTRLTLVHSGLPSSISAGYAAGWHAYLDRLAAVLGGDAPRAWDERFGEVFPSYREAVT